MIKAKEVIAVVLGVLGFLYVIVFVALILKKVLSSAGNSFNYKLQVTQESQWEKYYRDNEKTNSNLSSEIDNLIICENFLHRKLEAIEKQCKKTEDRFKEHSQWYINIFITFFIFTVPIITLFSNDHLFSGTEYGRHDIFGANTICYTTTYGDHYHAAGCQYLYNSAHRTTVYKAEKNNSPCSKCDVGELDVSEKNNYTYCIYTTVSNVGFVVYIIYFIKKSKIKNKYKKKIRSFEEMADNLKKYIYKRIDGILGYISFIDKKPSLADLDYIKSLKEKLPQNIENIVDSDIDEMHIDILKKDFRKYFEYLSAIAKGQKEKHLSLKKELFYDDTESIKIPKVYDDLGVVEFGLVIWLLSFLGFGGSGIDQFIGNTIFIIYPPYAVGYFTKPDFLRKSLQRKRKDNI